MGRAVEIAPLGVDDLTGDEGHHEGFGTPGVSAWNRAFDFDLEVVGDDLVLLKDPCDKPLGRATLQRLAQGAFVIAIARAALERLESGLDHFAGPGAPTDFVSLAGTATFGSATAGLTVFAAAPPTGTAPLNAPNPRALSRSASRGSVGT